MIMSFIDTKLNVNRKTDLITNVIVKLEDEDILIIVS